MPVSSRSARRCERSGGGAGVPSWLGPFRSPIETDGQIGHLEAGGAVATVDPDGSPDARMILLKGVDECGFVFYTNLGSAKAKALMHDPRVALCFYWAEIGKQVRVRGRANIVSDEEADAYFATRQRLSQISAWASKQSQPMRGYFELETEVAKSALRFGLGKIPRPPFWSGFRARAGAN